MVQDRESWNPLKNHVHVSQAATAAAPAAEAEKADGPMSNADFRKFLRP